MKVSELKKFLEKCPNNGVVLVDTNLGYNGRSAENFRELGSGYIRVDLRPCDMEEPQS